MNRVSWSNTCWQMAEIFAVFTQRCQTGCRVASVLCPSHASCLRSVFVVPRGSNLSYRDLHCPQSPCSPNLSHATLLKQHSLDCASSLSVFFGFESACGCAVCVSLLRSWSPWISSCHSPTSLAWQLCCRLLCLASSSDYLASWLSCEFDWGIRATN